MSGKRVKTTSQPPLDPQPIPVESQEPARVVAIPKEQPTPPPAPQSRVKTEAPKMERIGDILRRARLAKNDDLYLIAEYLRIKPHFLVALENSHYDELPADAYVIGFLRTYANFLGVDGKDAVDRYRYEMAGRRKKPILSMPTPVTEGRAPTGIIMAGATLALLLVYALWYGISSSNRAEVSAAPPLPTVAQSLPTADASANTATNAAAGLTAPVTGTTTTVVTTAPLDSGIMITKDAPKEQVLQPVKDASVKDMPVKDSSVKDAPKDADKKPEATKAPTDPNASRITIRATQSSWVMITDDEGKAVYDHVLKPGESYKVPNKPGLSLTTGNGSGIILSLDGTDLPKVANGAPHVVRNIDLTPDRLSAQ